MIYKKIEEDKAIRAAANYVAGQGLLAPVPANVLTIVRMVCVPEVESRLSGDGFVQVVWALPSTAGSPLGSLATSLARSHTRSREPYHSLAHPK